ncbi:hypothetical protein Prudu_355S000100, partial [Prunus dulcis]
MSEQRRGLLRFPGIPGRDYASLIQSLRLA